MRSSNLVLLPVHETDIILVRDSELTYCDILQLSLILSKSNFAILDLRHLRVKALRLSYTRAHCCRNMLLVTWSFATNLFSTDPENLLEQEALKKKKKKKTRLATCSGHRGSQEQVKWMAWLGAQKCLKFTDYPGHQAPACLPALCCEIVMP